MIKFVSETLLDFMPALKDIPQPEPIPHQFSKELYGKSNVLNLGVVHENPSSSDGVLQIMRHLQTYCPDGKDDHHVHSVLCNGDGLSVERMRTAKQDVARTPSSRTRLEGLVPSPQEFHKEGILMKVHQ